MAKFEDNLITPENIGQYTYEARRVAVENTLAEIVKTLEEFNQTENASREIALASVKVQEALDILLEGSRKDREKRGALDRNK